MNINKLNKKKVLNIALVLLAFVSFIPDIMVSNVSLGYSYVNAAWAAYNQDVVSALMAIGGNWLVIASAAFITSPASLVLFL
ncbi:hypothetical protein [uncultured Anaerococcus sp.]|uniref:hypothetical protein n=1 Tax=uncultured Anaerococcus sp. TaxID=293428 RepID=UPI0025F83717|nr:hypothetical protein [uncultured Anaerococcus sp.]